jgi:hypothetical protein
MLFAFPQDSLDFSSGCMSHLVSERREVNRWRLRVNKLLRQPYQPLFRTGKPLGGERSAIPGSKT